uniref:OCIA domain-containing protein 1 n=1 Tax=Salvator merianae TaxID=96440 RepID=A0A8D0BC67_SALMN
MMDYIPTEEERRVFAECDRESFWTRSLPISAVSMLVTEMLVRKGILATYTRFGSLPKVMFAGICGFLIGKISYAETCRQKLLKLENSPIAEALSKQRAALPGYAQKPEFTYESVPEAEAVQSDNYSVDSYGMTDLQSTYEPAPLSSSLSDSSHPGMADEFPQEPIPSLNESPKRKGITYEELRSRNRQMNEAGITQKAEISSRASQERLIKPQGKVNQYGDTWEE